MSTATANPLNAMLKAAAASTPATKKDAVPELSVPALSAQIKRRTEIDRMIDDLEAEKKALDADIIKEAEPLRRAECRKGKFHSSVRLNSLVTYICMNKYSAIPMTQEESLRKAFGQDFDADFTTETEIKVDVSKLTPEILAPLLVAGAATVKQYLKPTEKLHHDVALNDSVATVATTHAIKPVAYVKG